MSVRDVIQAAAGAAGTTADKTYVEDVFSCTLYTGNGSTQTINNGIDLAGKGGMVWVKSRSSTTLNHAVVDTVRGAYNTLYTNTTGAASGAYATVGSFSSTGFNVTNSSDTGNTNASSGTYASWTFRKAPKFFDVVTYTGDGTTNRSISHSLGTTPGMIIVKRTDSTGNWSVWHKDKTGNGTTGPGLYLNLASVYPSDTSIFSVTQGSNSFTVAPVGASIINLSGATYVAYLFAHDTTTDGLIQCGSFTTDASGNATVNLGWEPQYVMTKRSASVGNWNITDTMRGMPVDTNGALLNPNLTDAESAISVPKPNATGFTVSGFPTNTAYIYMAIRRGPMRTPTDGTKVFSPNAYSKSATIPVNVTTNFPIDVVLTAERSGWVYNFSAISRLQGIRQSYGGVLITSSTGAEVTPSSTYYYAIDNNTGYTEAWANPNKSVISHAFRRAPGFFDVVCYTGTGAARTVNHNLGVAPELVIIKSRSHDDHWYAYAKTGNTAYVSSSNSTPFSLNATTAATAQTSATYLNLVSDSTFSTSCAYIIGSYGSNSGTTYVAYLFASCPGVSKVGTMTLNGTDQNIDCGFTNGARFVMSKRTDAVGNWLIWDTARGIVDAADPILYLNTTGAEVTSNDYIDPYPGGFKMTAAAGSGTFLYLAIA